MRAIGLDFGTTNSALAIADGDEPPRLARFESTAGTANTFRSVLYFERDPDHKDRVHGLAGPLAIERYLAAEEPGRLMLSLKSFLAARDFSSTSVFGSSYRLEGLIALILGALRRGAEAQFGALSGRVVVGRPVRFANARDGSDEEFALARLEAALHNAGFPEVFFEYEPVAAAYHYERDLDHDELILIADFGGGTSDFSLIRVGPSVRGDRERAGSILGTDGVAVAGDAFDGRMVRNLVAPLLGLGTEYRNVFGQVFRVPSWIYAHLQRWHHLSFLKSRRTLQLLFDLRREALEPERIDALIRLVEQDLGFQLYRSVESAKFELSNARTGSLRFRESALEIDEPVTRGDFESWISEEIAAIAGSVDRLLERAAIGRGDVDQVFMTGGTSLVPLVRSLFEERFGAARIRTGQELTSVASGLALRAKLA